MVRRQFVAKEITHKPTDKPDLKRVDLLSIDSSAITQPIIGREAITSISNCLARSGAFFTKMGRKSASIVSSSEAQRIKSQIAAAKAYSIASDLKELETVFLTVHMHNGEAAVAFNEFKRLNGRSMENFQAVAMQEAVRRLSARHKRVRDLIMDYGIDSSRTPKGLSKLSFYEYPLAQILDELEVSASRIYNLGEELFSKDHIIPAEKTYLLSYDLRRIQGELLAFLNKDLESAKAYAKGIEIYKSKDKIFGDLDPKFETERYVQNGYIRYCVNSFTANTVANEDSTYYNIKAGDAISDCAQLSNSFIEKKDGVPLVISKPALIALGIEQYGFAIKKLGGNYAALVKQLQEKITKLNTVAKSERKSSV